MKFLTSIFVSMCLMGCMTSPNTVSQKLYSEAEKFCGTTNPRNDIGTEPVFTEAQRDRLACITIYVRTQCIMFPIDARVCGQLDKSGY